jgi:hypothetical protein
MDARPGGLSLAAKPRDVQFSGPFVEMFFDRAQAEWRDLRFLSPSDHAVFC